MTEMRHGPLPGMPGSQQGQIKTSMCPENVDNDGGGKTHDYSKAQGSVKFSANGDLIEGPGAKGTAGGVTKAGSNKPGRW